MRTVHANDSSCYRQRVQFLPDCEHDVSIACIYASSEWPHIKFERLTFEQSSVYSYKNQPNAFKTSR